EPIGLSALAADVLRKVDLQNFQTKDQQTNALRRLAFILTIRQCHDVILRAYSDLFVRDAVLAARTILGIGSISVVELQAHVRKVDADIQRALKVARERELRARVQDDLAPHGRPRIQELGPAGHFAPLLTRYLHQCYKTCDYRKSRSRWAGGQHDVWFLI